MKWIKFTRIDKYNAGTDDAPQWREIPTDVMLSCCKYNEEVAKREAYNGEYTIEDDGQPEPEPTPSEGDSAVWDELDAAYQEGVDSV